MAKKQETPKAGEQARRGSRPDPGGVTRHPQGPGALRRIDTGAPGRGGKGGPEVSPVARSVADGVLFRLEAGGVFANPKALDTFRIHNKYTTSDSHAPNGTCKHCRINAESISCVLRYNPICTASIPAKQEAGTPLSPNSDRRKAGLCPQRLFHRSRQWRQVLDHSAPYRLDIHAVILMPQPVPDSTYVTPRQLRAQLRRSLTQSDGRFADR